MPELNPYRSCSLLAAALALSWSAMASDYVLENGGFDEDLSGWENLYDRPAVWDPLDADGSEFSGSALLTYEGESNNATPIVLTQCVRVNANTEVVFGGEFYIEPGQPVDTSARAWLRVYSEADCSGDATTLDMVESSATGSWNLVEQTVLVGPVVKSMEMRIGVYKPGGETADASARFDNLYMYVSQFLEGHFVDPSMSTVWFNPAEPGHGVMLHLMSASSAWACWYMFDLDGNRSFVCGLGTIDTDTISFPNVFIVEGGVFPPMFDPDLIVEVPWGTITMTFSSCDEGQMVWTTDAAGYQSGNMPLVRLVNLWNNRCTQED